MNVCSIEGCNNPVQSKGLCSKHYQRLWKHKDPNKINRRHRPECKVEGCHNLNWGHGYCTKHYKKYKRYGDPSISKIIRNKGKICSVNGCNEPAKFLGFCKVHYTRQYIRGKGTKCKLSYCDRPADARGYCSYHYHLLQIANSDKEFEETFGNPPYQCYICGRVYNTWNPKELELDHIISRFNGGENSQENLLPACKLCNKMKNKFSLEEFLDKCYEIYTFHHTF